MTNIAIEATAKLNVTERTNDALLRSSSVVALVASATTDEGEGASPSCMLGLELGATVGKSPSNVSISSVVVLSSDVVVAAVVVAVVVSSNEGGVSISTTSSVDGGVSISTTSSLEGGVSISTTSSVEGGVSISTISSVDGGVSVPTNDSSSGDVEVSGGTVVVGSSSGDDGSTSGLRKIKEPIFVV